MAEDRNNRHLYQIERGNQAMSIRGVIAPFVNQKIQDAVAALVAMYRGGDIKHDLLIGKVGEISVLMHILGQLEVEQARGQQAMQKEMKDAP